MLWESMRAARNRLTVSSTWDRAARSAVTFTSSNSRATETCVSAIVLHEPHIWSPEGGRELASAVACVTTTGRISGWPSERYCVMACSGPAACPASERLEGLQVPCHLLMVRPVEERVDAHDLGHLPDGVVTASD